MKKLFLASEAKDPQSIEKLRAFIGKPFEELHIAYVPTAANATGYGSWRGRESLNVIRSLGSRVTIVELEEIGFQNIEESLKNADVIWVGGGMTGYLLYWMRRTKLDILLPRLLESGIVYVGSSAGSMICSKTQYLADWYVGEEEPGASLIPGLGLIDFEIYPHYDEALRAQIEQKWQKGKVYLLKDGEAITITESEVTFPVDPTNRLLHG